MGAAAVERDEAWTGLLAGRFAVGRRRARTPATDVFAGWDHLLDAGVTVEVFRPEARPAHRYRREREVVALAGLDHPALLAVHDHGVDPSSGRAYVVTTPPDGLTLAARIARGPQRLERVLAVGAQLASGLAHLHAAGYVHRRLTPATIRLRRSGEPVLVDLDGVATLDIETITLEEAVALGDATFLAPEQIAGHEVGPTADVFSLGRILERCLAAPAAHVGADPSRPVTTTPPAVRRLLAAMTEPDPERRLGAARVVDEIDALRHTPGDVGSPPAGPAGSAGPAGPAGSGSGAVRPDPPRAPDPAPHRAHRPPEPHPDPGRPASHRPASHRPSRRRTAVVAAVVLGVGIELAALGLVVGVGTGAAAPAGSVAPSTGLTQP